MKGRFRETGFVCANTALSATNAVILSGRISCPRAVPSLLSPVAQPVFYLKPSPHWTHLGRASPVLVPEQQGRKAFKDEDY